MRPIIALVLVAGCYAPQLAPCEIHCGHDSPCPADLSCGDDHRCHDDHHQSCGATLDVTTSGNGGGRVTSSPNGVDCASNDPGNGCSAIPFTTGTTITLSADPFGADRFGGWGGDACDGSNDPTCTFDLDMAMTVDAHFF